MNNGFPGIDGKHLAREAQEVQDQLPDEESSDWILGLFLFAIVAAGLISFWR